MFRFQLDSSLYLEWGIHSERCGIRWHTELIFNGVDGKNLAVFLMIVGKHILLTFCFFGFNKYFCLELLDARMAELEDALD